MESGFDSQDINLQISSTSWSGWTLTTSLVVCISYGILLFPTPAASGGASLLSWMFVQVSSMTSCPSWLHQADYQRGQVVTKYLKCDPRVSTLLSITQQGTNIHGRVDRTLEWFISNDSSVFWERIVNWNNEHFLSQSVLTQCLVRA